MELPFYLNFPDGSPPPSWSEVQGGRCECQVSLYNSHSFNSIYYVLTQIHRVPGHSDSWPVTNAHPSKKTKFQLVSRLRPQYARLLKGGNKGLVKNALNMTDHAATPEDQLADLVHFGGLPDEEGKHWQAPSTMVSTTLHKPAKALPKTKVSDLLSTAPLTC